MMAVTAAQLQAEVNTTLADDPVLQRVLDVADALLAQYVEANATTIPHGIPQAVYDEALLITAVDAFNRRQAPNGVLTQQFDAGEVPVRISSDPLRAARIILAPWCSAAGIA